MREEIKLMCKEKHILNTILNFDFLLHLGISLPLKTYS